MTIYRTKTFSDIYNAVARRIKIPVTDDRFLKALKESINSRYTTIAFRKKWRWRRRYRSVRIPAKYTTGTVAVTNASSEVTFAGTALTSDHKGWWINITGTDENYKVIAVNVAAQTAMLSSEYVGTTNASASYTLYKFEHGLVPDCEEVEFAWTDKTRRPITICSPNEIMGLITRNPQLEGWPEYLSVGSFTRYIGPKLGDFVLGYDFLAGEEEKYLEALTFPAIPDQDYVMHLNYMVKIDEMEADDDEPLIPIEKRQILVYGALSDMFDRERNNEASNKWETKFDKELMKMENDQEYTDEKPRLHVAGKWWRRGLNLSTEEYDLGSYFDKYYTPWEY